MMQLKILYIIIIFISVVFSFVGCAPDHTKIRIVGEVVDIENHSPIAGATVELRKMDWSTSELL